MLIESLSVHECKPVITVNKMLVTVAVSIVMLLVLTKYALQVSLTVLPTVSVMNAQEL